MITAGIVISFSVFIALCALCAVLFSIAGAKCEEARDEINFGADEFRCPPV